METTNMQMAEPMPGTSVETQPTQPAVPTLADVIGGGEEQPQQTTTTAPENAELKEPGYVQGRIQKAVEKVRAELRAEYEAQLAPLREAQMQREADELVNSGKISDRDMALEYVRGHYGKQESPKAANATAPNRDERGRFVSNNSTPAPKSEVPAEIQTRANELFAQAKAIQKYSGVDVLGIYQANPEYAERVNSGEWDMADVAKAASAKAPSPVRSSNGGSTGISSVNFHRMTANEFAKVNEHLARGGKIDASKEK